MSITVANFRDVADGLQPGQFQVGDRADVGSLADLDPTYKRLMDQPVTAVIAVMDGRGRPSLTPIWFDYQGDVVLLNFAAHRKKTEWLRSNPEFTLILVNPENPYHWMNIRGTVVNEIHEDDPRARQSGCRSGRPDLGEVHRQRATLRVT